MAFNYSPLSTTATNLIKNFGQSVTFTRNGSVTYDPTAGVSSSSQTTYTANIVLFDQTKREMDDTSLAEKEFPASMSSTTAPKIGDTATINGENYRILDVTPVQPGTSVIYYEARLRS
jgi:hypothetical protein|tara:strand:+ start:646 stop:999 length:354 start_codon:yes stop_codon:yes gene_type:complete